MSRERLGDVNALKAAAGIPGVAGDVIVAAAGGLIGAVGKIMAQLGAMSPDRSCTEWRGNNVNHSVHSCGTFSADVYVRGVKCR